MSWNDVVTITEYPFKFKAVSESECHSIFFHTEVVEKNWKWKKYSSKFKGLFEEPLHQY